MDDKAGGDLVTLVLLAGCSVPQPGEGHANVYPIGLFGQRVVSNDAYVTVSNVWSHLPRSTKRIILVGLENLEFCHINSR